MKDKRFDWSKPVVKPQPIQPGTTMRRLKAITPVSKSKHQLTEEYNQTAAWNTKPTSKAKNK